MLDRGLRGSGHGWYANQKVRADNGVGPEHAQETSAGTPSTNHPWGWSLTSADERRAMGGAPTGADPPCLGANSSRYSVGPALRACSPTKPASATAQPPGRVVRDSGPRRCRSRALMISGRGSFERV